MKTRFLLLIGLTAWMGLASGCLFLPKDRRALALRNQRMDSRLDDIQESLASMTDRMDMMQVREQHALQPVEPVLRPAPKPMELPPLEPSKKQRIQSMGERHNIRPVLSRKESAKRNRRSSRRASRMSLKAKHIRVPFEVKVIQQALANAGANPGPADGKVGERTIAAIRRFQQANQLKVDGVVGKETWSKLQAHAPAVR
jgi:murein L,D-transpeptidase YcbB/YkuD